MELAILVGIEGLWGVGKTTLARHLKSKLAIAVLPERVLTRDVWVNDLMEGRNVLEEVIKSLLAASAKDTDVVMERSYVSALVHSRVEHPESVDAFRSAIRQAIAEGRLAKLDLVIFLRAPIETLRVRGLSTKRASLLDEYGRAYEEVIRDHDFSRLLEVDASQGSETVAKAVEEFLVANGIRTRQDLS